MKDLGIIFDFNGTMFFDSKKHVEAWSNYVSDLAGITLNREEVGEHILGRTSKYILEHFLGYEISDDTCLQLSNEKENIYRRLCINDPDNLVLAPGLTKFLDYLTENDIPKTIASSANYENMIFYFETFDLYKWFDFEKIVYDDGTHKGKPAPDPFLIACKKIDVAPAHCMVFEDSVSGINAAIKAGIKNIVIVKGDNPHILVSPLNNITKVITDFTELK